MPYPEFRRWQLFYMLEPWGWQDNEYKTASLLAMLYNANAGKGKGKAQLYYMRDMAKEVLKQLEPKPNLSALPVEQQRELVTQSMKSFFGV